MVRVCCSRYRGKSRTTVKRLLWLLQDGYFWKPKKAEQTMESTSKWPQQKLKKHRSLGEGWKKEAGM